MVLDTTGSPARIVERLERRVGAGGRGYHRDSLAVEAKSRAILEDYIQQFADEGLYVLTDKGRLSREMQARHADDIVSERKIGELRVVADGGFQ